jgi:spermidine/putrescine-binding protein
MCVMKDTIEVQKGMMKDMNVDNVYDLMDDMRDMQDAQNEFSEAFQRNYDVEIEDEELDAELDQLDYESKIELSGKELCVPNKRILSQKENDEKELEELAK